MQPRERWQKQSTVSPVKWRENTWCKFTEREVDVVSKPGIPVIQQKEKRRYRKKKKTQKGFRQI